MGSADCSVPYPLNTRPGLWFVTVITAHTHTEVYQGEPPKRQ